MWPHVFLDLSNEKVQQACMVEIHEFVSKYDTIKFREFCNAKMRAKVQKFYESWQVSRRNEILILDKWLAPTPLLYHALFQNELNHDLIIFSSFRIWRKVKLYVEKQNKCLFYDRKIILILWQGGKVRMNKKMRSDYF